MDPRKEAILSRMRTPLKQQWMTARVVDARNGESGSGRPQAIIALAPLVNGRPDRDLKQLFYMGYTKEKDKPHERGKVAGKAYGFLNAIGAVPARPRKVGNDQMQLSTGEVVTYRESDKASAAVDEAVFTALALYRDNEAELKKCIGKDVFLLPDAPEFDPETFKVSQFIKYINAEVREGTEVLSSDLVDDSLMEQYIQQAGLA